MLAAHINHKDLKLVRFSFHRSNQKIKFGFRNAEYTAWVTFLVQHKHIFLILVSLLVLLEKGALWIACEAFIIER